MADTPLETYGLTFDEAVERLTIMNERGKQENADDLKDALQRLAQPSPNLTKNDSAP